MRENTLLKEFFRYVCLNILGMIGLSCYILADTFFIARGLGAKGLTALNLAIPIYSFVNGCGLMLGMGGATKYSIFLGKKEYRQGNRCFFHVILAASSLSLVFILAGIFFSETLALALGADREVFWMTKTYLQIILLFSPAFIFNGIFVCFVRNDGNPSLSMTAMLVGSLSNIILDYILIFPLQLGILGAVLATGCSPVISMCILLKHKFSGKNHFGLEKSQFSPGFMAGILSLGIPSLITEVASGIAMIVFNSLILGLSGNTGVAAYGVVANLSLVVTSIFTGIAQGFQPLASHSYGRGKKEEIQKLLHYALTLVLFISGITYLVFFCAAAPITTAFNSEGNQDLQKIAVMGMKLYFTSIPFMGLNIILSTYFTSGEQALPAQGISLSRGFFLLLPTAFLLARLFGMTGVFLSCPVTEFIVFAMGLLFYCKRNPPML
ncbi:MAG: MATE family efflux transporter [Lachnospiraceae bacterium]|nr:MATE family efflux transporter [Lachnospiraceae bacterium]